MPGPITVDIANQASQPAMENGAQKTENADGSVTIDLNPQTTKPKQTEGFYENLALKIDESELSRIASELLEGIERDNLSRKEWLETRARGIALLGLKLDEPRGDLGTSSVPLEGMSTVRHPLLLESTLRFHANARGELLPAAGPVKVRNDTPPPPPESAAPAPITPQMPPQMPAPPPGGGQPGPGMPQQMGAGPAPTPPQAPPAPPPPKPPSNVTDELAQALELDMNHYLTAVATEYYPDTDRMLFWVGAGGQGIKKVYNCPIRQRPVSESVDAEDIIVSNAATNLENCGRITHRIKMRPSTLARMQIIGAYRDVELAAAPAMPTTTNAVDQKKAEIQGVRPQPQPPQDAEHEIYETYCELNISGYEHKSKGKVTGLQCPYKVVIHKESRQVLEIRRNWKEGDALCMPKQFFVDFAFVRALGFYAIGLIHIAGNTTNALTAAWREMLDAGMFASFPGFIYSKQAGRQLTNQFRVPPGGGIGLEVGPNGRISDAVMPLPYKEPGAGFSAFITHIEEVGQRVAGTAEVNVGEGTQEVPVGTTMAMIEQATKVIDAVHKRLHAAQAQEFKLLKERFREDPEAFWRHNKKPTIQWQKDQFIAALDRNELVPVADPNNPTSLHRIAKATAIKILQQANPAIYDAMAVDKRIMRIVGIDPEGLFLQSPAPPPPDPSMEAVKQKAAAQQQQAQQQHFDTMVKAATEHEKLQNMAAERQSREQIEKQKAQIENTRLMQEIIIHGNEAKMEQDRAKNEMVLDHARNVSEIMSDHVKGQHEMQMEQVRHQHELGQQQDQHEADLQQASQQHQMDLQHSQQTHSQDLEHAKALNAAKVEATKAMAKAKPKPASKKKE